MNEEARTRLSQVMSARWANKQQRESLLLAIRDAKRPTKVVSEETKQKISASRAAAWRDCDRDQMIAAQRKGVQAAWDDPVKKAARVEKLRATRARKAAQRLGSPGDDGSPESTKT